MYFKELTICFPLKDSYFTRDINKINMIDQNLKNQNQNQSLNVWTQDKFIFNKHVREIFGSPYSLEYLHFY